MIACFAAGCVALVVLGNLRPGSSSTGYQPADPSGKTGTYLTPPATGIAGEDPPRQTSGEDDARFAGLLADVRRRVDFAMASGDHEAAERHVDNALADAAIGPVERQRLMVVKLGTRGMRGDHVAMLEVMDEIIAEDPTSTIAARIIEERPRIREFHRLGPDHPVFCETCRQEHPPGHHVQPQDVSSSNDGK